MGKLWRIWEAVAFVVVFVWLGGVLQDHETLREDILRLHVLAQSDETEDQAVKELVRDGVLQVLEQSMDAQQSRAQAEQTVERLLPKLEQTANEILEREGFPEQAKVELALEPFPVRHYDTFSLPSGVYHTLRVTIGEGKGHNWWCVIFPKLCLSASGEEFGEMSGFSDTLNDTLTGNYEIRFWLLDQLGRLENFLHGSSGKG